MKIVTECLKRLTANGVINPDPSGLIPVDSFIAIQLEVL